MGLFDALFGSGNTTTKTKTQLPGWYDSVLHGLASGATDVANRPYQAYGGPRIAPFGQDQNAAFANTRAGIGQYSPYVSGGAGMVQQAGQPGLNQGVFNSYLSPYTSGVVDRIAQLGQRNLSENLLPQVNTTFTGSGQFGGSRHADFTGRAVRDANESIMGQQATALENAQNAAMNAYGSGQTRSMEAGRTYAGLGQVGQQMGLTDAAALEAIGNTQQGQTQQNLNLGYQDFQNQFQYPQQQAGWLASILYGSPENRAGTQTTTGPGTGGSPISQLGGLAIGGLGLAGGLGAFGAGGMMGANPPNIARGIFYRGGMVDYPPRHSVRRRPAPPPGFGSPRPMAGIGGMGGGPAMMQGAM